MAKHIVLLRGINLGPRNRVPMAPLRAALTTAGFGDVQTYLQSGNVVLSSRKSPEAVAADVNRVIRREFGLDIAVVVRSAAEISDVVRRNPLASTATDPRRYLVTFLSGDVPPDFAADLRAASSRQPFEIIGREVYSWHPDGVGRSPLWERLARRERGIDGTTRNWATVTALLAMAGADTDR